ncbi:hypothetical protein E2C01_008548 [Portunus trituberculatus]|uniref:Uncharacterized protein n=1 Tax=Portunus trituberculatus TaxID=210409 RepID=A0A5B7D4U5_PORTR|nr:hypothetical protein [Portunus trituberculatus]
MGGDERAVKYLNMDNSVAPRNQGLRDSHMGKDKLDVKDALGMKTDLRKKNTRGLRGSCGTGDK